MQVLFDSSISGPRLPSAALKLIQLTSSLFALYSLCNEVEDLLISLLQVRAQQIFFPLQDQRKPCQVFDECEVKFLINLRSSVPERCG